MKGRWWVIYSSDRFGGLSAVPVRSWLGGHLHVLGFTQHRLAVVRDRDCDAVMGRISREHSS